MLINAALLITALSLCLAPTVEARTHGPRRLTRRTPHIAQAARQLEHFPEQNRVLKKRALTPRTPDDAALPVHTGIMLQKRDMRDGRRSRARAVASRKRTLNDPPTGQEVHIPLQPAPPSDAHPLQRYYALQAHAVSRHARAIGQEVDVAALRKRAMPIGQGKHHYKPKPVKESAGRIAAVEASVAGTAQEGFSQTAAQAAVDNSVTKSETPSAKNTLGLDIEGADVGYFADVQIGTPPKTFKILMDSGSADFWVPSQACKNCGKHQALGSKTSSTFQTSNSSFAVTYGTGEVDGSIVKDDVAIGTLKLPGHVFGVATTESVEFSSNETPFDGLMGLAQSSLSEQAVLTPIESLAQQGATTAAQMGYRLASVSDGPNDSQVTFGGVDNTKFTGSLTLLDNVSKQGFWEAAMDDVTVSGKALKLSGRSAILDTGTTLIVAPTADANAVHAAIPGAQSDGNGGFTIPCTTTATVSLVFGGKSFTMKGSDLAFLPVDAADLTGSCTSGITAGQIGGAGEWLVGASFLKTVYFATDVENNQVGLAPAK